MKKIISLISVVVISLTAFCIPAFAQNNSVTKNFVDVFTGKYILVTDLTSNYYTDLSEPPYYFEIVETSDWEHLITSYDIRFEYSGTPINAGDLLTFDLSVSVNTVDFFENVKSNIYLQCYNSVTSSWGNWVKCGSVDVVQYGIGYYKLNMSCSYHFIEKPDKLRFSLSLINDNQETYKQFVSCIAVFDTKVTNYYLGSMSSPEAPKYNSNNETINKADDLKEQEDKLMEDTEQGKEETLSLFQNFGKYLDEFAVPLLAIKGLFDYLVGGTLFEGILLISLTLGLLSFVFNIFPSIQARQNRERQAEAQRTKNAQYNAMMNKLNNQNKGGG